MSMETQTGFVRAWVGGANFDYFKVDHCNINTKRQVGSLFKSIVYTLNIQNGQPICDLKRSFTKSTGKVSSYLLNNISIPAIIDLSRQLGIVSDLPPYTPIALGAVDVSLYEMMQVYSTFPNAGYNIKPQFLLSIKDKYGKDIYRFIEERKRVISDTVASKMIYLMKKAVDSAGTGASLKQRFDLKDIQIVGKTGTTNKYTDAWFIGFTPEVITGVWVGCDDPLIHLHYESNGQGAAAAMPVFGLFLNKIYNDKNLGFNKKLNFFVSKDSSLLNISCNDL
jgi:penicillin-binding protein 1A